MKKWMKRKRLCLELSEIRNRLKIYERWYYEKYFEIYDLFFEITTIIIPVFFKWIWYFYVNIWHFKLINSQTAIWKKKSGRPRSRKPSKVHLKPFYINKKSMINLFRTAIQQNNTADANKLLKDLSNAYHSANSLNLKKGVLLALAAAAIGFGKNASPYLKGKFPLNLNVFKSYRNVTIFRISFQKFYQNFWNQFYMQQQSRIPVFAILPVNLFITSLKLWEPFL